MAKSKWPPWIKPEAKAAMLKLSKAVKEFEVQHGTVALNNPRCQEIDSMTTSCCEKDTDGDGNCPVHQPIVLKKGTVVKVDGIPLLLSADTECLTHPGNFELLEKT